MVPWMLARRVHINTVPWQKDRGTAIPSMLVGQGNSNKARLHAVLPVDLGAATTLYLQLLLVLTTNEVGTITIPV